MNTEITSQSDAQTFSVRKAVRSTWAVLGEPEGAVKNYVTWMMSDAGQKVVEASGYVPLPAEARAKP